MTSKIEQRLRKLEVAASGPPLVRVVWSDTSDAHDWDRQIADMIASGEASPSDEFMRVGWMPPLAPDSPNDAHRKQPKKVTLPRLKFLDPK
jgi:hypothetical protein